MQGCEHLLAETHGREHAPLSVDGGRNPVMREEEQRAGKRTVKRGNARPPRLEILSPEHVKIRLKDVPKPPFKHGGVRSNLALVQSDDREADYPTQSGARFHRDPRFVAS